MLSGVAFFSYVMENTARLAEDYKVKLGTDFAKEEKVIYYLWNLIIWLFVV